MTLIMIASTAMHTSSPMLGEYTSNPAWKMKQEESDDDEANFFGGEFDLNDLLLDERETHDLLASFADVDVQEMASYLEMPRSGNGFNFIWDDENWLTGDDAEECSNSSSSFLTDTVLSLDHTRAEVKRPQELSSSALEAALGDHMYSAVSEDHMYSLSTRTSTESSHAASTSGYSSSTESLGSNEENSISLLSLAKPATSLLTQQARSLLKPKQLVETENVMVDSQIPVRSRKRARSRVSPLSRNKKWSRMEDDEQKDSIMELTNIISSQLGVRERLEAIRIINPQSTVSPADGEFVIDLKPINDTRFNKLQKFVRLHADDYSCTSSNTTKQKSFDDQQLTPSLSKDPVTICTASKAGRKRKGRGGRRETKSSISLELERREQQRAKEIESGLFVNEVRLSVSQVDPDVDKDDDIDNIDIVD